MWLSIDTKLWSLRAYNFSLAAITQRASNVTRYVDKSTLPNADAFAAMSERQFDGICRRAFHNDEAPKKRKGIY